MGTWGIALDMAKQNEVNLSKLSRKGMFSKLRAYGNGTNGKIYRYKKATPALLKSIRVRKEQARKLFIVKQLVLGTIIAAVFVVVVVLYF